MWRAIRCESVARPCRGLRVRLLCLGLDGADYDLVRRAAREGRLPTLATPVARGRLRPASLDDSGRHARPPGRPSSPVSTRRDTASSTSRPTRTAARSASRAPPAAPARRSGGCSAAPASAPRSSGSRSPTRRSRSTASSSRATAAPSSRRSCPTAARERILAAHPDLVTAHHPMAERWWEDFEGYARRLVEHVEQTADVCRLALELEPDLATPVRRLHELRPRRSPRLLAARPRSSGARSGAGRRRARSRSTRRSTAPAAA